MLKESAVIEIVAGIKAVADGQPFVSAALTSYLLHGQRRPTTTPQLPPGLQDLTPAERRVLRLIAEYKTSRDIAEELGVSSRTVENHRSNISQKLKLQGSHALLRFALEHQNELG